ncbi:Glycosyl transferase family 2 [Saccharopolyspora kobensis]|uniref:Glucosyl-3-phosphoglycerate synthase n=1 Tax=Saccharopolyspora kobensis TaxID=146035 RepID=A0A1H6E0V8_9PSEU|nr:glycosyltransferase [Saccharopolyspora kobensis]SEG90565.1 Glycosyl transferase family 2 [Saccharopolyspora kobensis]SFD92113.1 Glycosyl transferase family 2 [Saccharopolyspora kobensis]
MSRPEIDPALGLDLVEERTLSKKDLSVSVVIPAHNEEATIAQVVADAYVGLDVLGVSGDVAVSASGCTDRTAELAAEAGAKVVEAPAGKGAAISAGLAATSGDVVCLIDGDLQYFGQPPLSALLVRPILDGIADAVVSDLYWRPLYPQLWLHGFFAPVAGALFPELIAKVGSTPWSGQRAALRHLWPTELPTDFMVDLQLLLHWNRHAMRLRPVLADDWTNPQRPKPELMAMELEVLLRHAVADGRLTESKVPAVREWYEIAHRAMAEYRPDVDDPQEFERTLLKRSLDELRRCMAAS